MGISSHWCGHKIEFAAGVWIFSDTKRSVESNQERACEHCGEKMTENGHDGCLGVLLNVMNACCGHGAPDEAYIQFENGTIVSGKDTLELVIVNDRDRD